MLPLTRSKWEVAKMPQVLRWFLVVMYHLSDFPRTISGTPRDDKTHIITSAYSPDTHASPSKAHPCTPQMQRSACGATNGISAW